MLQPSADAFAATFGAAGVSYRVGGIVPDNIRLYPTARAPTGTAPSTHPRPRGGPPRSSLPSATPPTGSAAPPAAGPASTAAASTASPSNPTALQVTAQGRLDGGYSDHRAVWILIAPTGGTFNDS
jgi:hypothetical protein